MENVKDMTQAEKRSSLVGVRFLPEEKQKLQELAVEQYQTLSELIRVNALKPMEKTRRKFVPEMNRKLYLELGKISEYIKTLEINSEDLIELQELLDNVRRELIGIEPISEKHYK